MRATAWCGGNATAGTPAAAKPSSPKTETGLGALRAAQPAHLASARQRVLDHIPADILPGMAAARARLAETQRRAR
ncbi:hypothetical protein [Streptomyces sp. NPDC057838]|uniref:hypothetical protein n=1 Tax=unclassified Streptomyces TaxID=2593676 RepID=UPI0036ABA19A